MNRPPAPIHAVSTGGPPRLHDHRALSSCWCHPEQVLRDLATGAPIYMHRDVAEPGCGCSGCRALSARPQVTP
jgi:hypothetical protein